MHPAQKLVNVYKAELVQMVKYFPQEPWMESLSIRMLENHVMELRAKIRSESIGTIKDTQIIKIPKNWWQQFKAECLPNFILKRFPVVEKEIIVELSANVSALYPDMPLELRGATVNYYVANKRIDVLKDYTSSEAYRNSAGVTTI